MDGLTDGSYQVNYLPASLSFAVNKNLVSRTKHTRIFIHSFIHSFIPAPILNHFGARYTYRVVVIFGGTMFSLAYILMAFAPSVGVVVFAMGVAGGKRSLQHGSRSM